MVILPDGPQIHIPEPIPGKLYIRITQILKKCVANEQHISIYALCIDITLLTRWLPSSISLMTLAPFVPFSPVHGRRNAKERIIRVIFKQSFITII